MPKVVQFADDGREGLLVLGDDGSLWWCRAGYSEWTRQDLPAHFAPAAPPVPAPTKDATPLTVTVDPVTGEPLFAPTVPATEDGEVTWSPCYRCQAPRTKEEAERGGECDACWKRGNGEGVYSIKGSDAVATVIDGRCLAAVVAAEHTAPPSPAQAVTEVTHELARLALGYVNQPDPTPGALANVADVVGRYIDSQEARDRTATARPAAGTIPTGGNRERVHQAMYDRHQCLPTLGGKHSPLCDALTEQLDAAEQRGAAKALPAEAVEALGKWQALGEFKREAVDMHLKAQINYPLCFGVAARLLRALANTPGGRGT